MFLLQHQQQGVLALVAERVAQQVERQAEQQVEFRERREQRELRVRQQAAFLLLELLAVRER